MSNIAPNVTARDIIDTITHDAIEHVTYSPDDNESTVTFIDDTAITASEHCWDDEVTEDNVNGYSWVIHSPGDDPLDRRVTSSNHGDDLRDAIIEHADSVTPLPVHDVLTATIVNERGDSATVSWVPEEVTGYDEAKDNVGMREWAWGSEDEAPVYWKLDPGTHTYDLEERIVQFTGTTQLTLSAHKVDDEDELKPGTYWVRP